MTNFEKIDDYLANRLSADEKVAFEQALSGDPALRSEVALQEKIIGGIRQARAAELKQMLQQVPVPTGGWSPAQITAGVLAVGVIATSLYFYFRNDEAPAPAAAPEVTVQPEPAAQPTEPETKPETVAPDATEKKQTTTAPKAKAIKPVQKPDLQVVDHAAELTETPEPGTPAEAPARNEITVSKLEVMTLAPDKKYTFHYQFAEGKLRLYGPFDKNLYEILEINGDSHAVFLFYKENYYLLDESQHAVTPLAPIRDGQLLKMLREYRSR